MIISLPSTQRSAMTSARGQHVTRFVGLVVLLCVWSLIATEHSAAQDDEPAYQGFERCAFCHGRTLDEAVRPFRRDLCLLNEGLIWQQHDKHALAFKVLEGELAQQMGKRLGWEVTSDIRCLSCHANQRADKPPTADFQRFLAEGVGCEACHGPGSKYDQPHSQPSWRRMSPKEKAALGMIDVRDPLLRAQQCFSCHIGNAAQRKVITHEMYAAGHPPLPGIELESFALQMPRHWRYLPEKGSFEDEAAFVAANYAEQPNPREQLPQTREVAVGSVVALRESLRLTADLAEDQEIAWPELARYDCQACHHELRVPSWRQQRTANSNARPGRPLAPAWPTALMTPAIHALAQSNAPTQAHQFDAHMDAVHAAFASQPFGDSAAIVAAARAAADWLEQQLLAPARSTNIDRDAAQRALDEIFRKAQQETLDYDSARQLAWAAQVIIGELRSPYPDAFRNPMPDATEESTLATWRTWNEDVLSRNRAAVSQLFLEAGLQQSLSLKLPAGQSPAGADPAHATRLQQFLPNWLESTSHYDPEQFKSQMHALQQALK